MDPHQLNPEETLEEEIEEENLVSYLSIHTIKSIISNILSVNTVIYF